jgi:hypothetical protein
MKLKACNRIGLVLAGAWILGAILYTLCIFPFRIMELELASMARFPDDDGWMGPRLAIVALVSAAAYLLPFLVRWILKGFVDSCI